LVVFATLPKYPVFAFFLLFLGVKIEGAEGTEGLKGAEVKVGALVGVDFFGGAELLVGGTEVARVEEDSGPANGMIILKAPAPSSLTVFGIVISVSAVALNDWEEKRREGT